MFINVLVIKLWPEQGFLLFHRLIFY